MKSQEDAILAHLMEHAGQWCPMPRLGEISGSMAVSTRISCIRAAGWNIVNRVDRSTRPYRSFFMLK